LLRFNRDIGVGTRLAIATGLPCLCILILTAILAVEHWHSVGAMGRLNDLAKLSVRAGALVHELQKERGMSAIYINTDGRQMSGELPGQRQLVDQRLQEFTRMVETLDLPSYPAPVQAAVRGAVSVLPELANWRTKILAREVKGADSNGYFTRTIAALLAPPAEAVKSSDDADINGALIGYANYLTAKEQSGQERAGGAVGITTGRLSREQYSRLTTIIADQLTFFRQFQHYANPEQRAYAAEAERHPAFQEQALMREKLLTFGPDSPITGMTSAEWYRVTTARIDEMKRIEDRLARDLSTLAESKAEAARQTLLVMGGSVLAAITICASLATIVALGIARPVGALARRMTALVDGDLTTPVPGAGNQDEIGTMARAVETFRNNKDHADRLEAEREEGRRDQKERTERMEALAKDFDARASDLLGSVGDAAQSLRATAGGMSQTAQAASRRASDIAHHAEAANSNVQAVAAAAEELSASVVEISRQVAQSSEVAARAVEDARRTDGVVRALDEGAQRIGQVIGLINGIAGQTNLLALNATIEAARAGDAGKGFAVVASEVKSLANQTARATEDISRQIERIQASTREAVGAIEGIGARIGEVSEIATAIAAAVEEQGAATREIARNVQQAAKGSGEVTSTINEVGSNAAEMGTAAGQVASAADTLADQAREMSGEVTGFLDRIKRA
jgi:methyl-accepting chemotaxis protein